MEYRSALSLLTVKKWTGKFKRSRTLLEEDPRKGQPKTSTTSEKTETEHRQLDKRLNVYELARVENILKERKCYILNDEIGMTKFCAK